MSAVTADKVLERLSLGYNLGICSSMGIGRRLRKEGHLFRYEVEALTEDASEYAIGGLSRESALEIATIVMGSELRGWSVVNSL